MAKNIYRLDELVELLGITPWEVITEKYPDVYASQYTYAYDEAQKDGASEVEAEEQGLKAESDARDEDYQKWKQALINTAETYLGYHHLELKLLPKSGRKKTREGARAGREFKIVAKEPSRKRSLRTGKAVDAMNWEQPVEDLLRTINGVGQFQFNSVEEFKESIHTTSSKELVLEHLPWIKYYGAVYGQPSPARLMENYVRRNPLDSYLPEICNKCFQDPCQCPCQSCGQSECNCCKLCGCSPLTHAISFVTKIDHPVCRCPCHGHSSARRNPLIYRRNPITPQRLFAVLHRAIWPTNDSASTGEAKTARELAIRYLQDVTPADLSQLQTVLSEVWEGPAKQKGALVKFKEIYAIAVKANRVLPASIEIAANIKPQTAPPKIPASSSPPKTQASSSPSKSSGVVASKSPETKATCKACDGRGVIKKIDKDNVMKEKTSVCSRCGGSGFEPGPPKGKGGKWRGYTKQEETEDEKDVWSRRQKLKSISK